MTEKVYGPEEYSLVGSQGVALVIYKLRKMGIICQEAPEGLKWDIVAFPFGKPVRIQVKSTQSNDKRGVMRFRLTTGRYGEQKRPYNLDDADIIAFVALHLEAVTFQACIDLPEQINISRSRLEKDVILGDSFALECQKVWKETGAFDPPKKQRKKRVIPEPKEPVW